MKDTELPAIYQSADHVAISSQRAHYRLILIQLLILVMVAFLASVSWSSYKGIREPVALIIAVFLIIAFALNALVYAKKYDKAWFVMRSIAESVKVESWRFIMRAQPYDLSESESEAVFIRRLQEMINIQRPLPADFLAENPTTGEITRNLRSLRQLNFEERKSYYFENRLEDQKNWYSDRAKINNSKERLWFSIFWSTQVLAIIIAMIIVGIGLPLLDSVGVLTTVAAASLTWREAKRFSELTQSYGMVSKELSLTQSRALNAVTEDSFREIVNDVERIISREHTFWLTRRL